MRAILVSALSGLALCAVAVPSHASPIFRIMRIAAGPACQLSIPTTDTQARPKATGFRNEGTKSEFVICQVDTPSGELTFSDIYLGSTDGVARSVSCTAVNGHSITPNTIAYSSKSVSTTAGGTYGSLGWNAADFGGAGPNMPHSGFFSITCTLPPKTFIGVIGMQYSEDIGA